MNPDHLIEAVIDREGGYADLPGDRGGPTRFGITQAVARAAGYEGDMRALPRATAVAIYRRRFWTEPGLDGVAALAPTLAVALFDTGVNMGPPVAIGFLQRALNALNRGATLYPDVGLDGRLGSATLGVLAAFLHGRGAAGETVLLRATEALQGERYLSLAERRPADEAFLYGWLANRIGPELAGAAG